MINKLSQKSETRVNNKFRDFAINTIKLYMALPRMYNCLSVQYLNNFLNKSRKCLRVLLTQLNHMQKTIEYEYDHDSS